MNNTNIIIKKNNTDNLIKNFPTIFSTIIFYQSVTQTSKQRKIEVKVKSIN